MIDRLAVCSWSMHPADPLDLVEKLRATHINRVQLALDPLREAPGIWGEAVMPVHPDISPEESEKIMDCILNVGGNPNVNYKVGKEGSFRMELPPGVLDGFFVLKASYTDTGLKDQPKENLSGEDVIVIRYK